jgi:hypothetical protein
MNGPESHCRNIFGKVQRCTRFAPSNVEILSALKFPDRHRAQFSIVLRGNDVQCVAIILQRHITAATITLSLLPLSGHSGRRRTSCSLDPVANDPKRTYTHV